MPWVDRTALPPIPPSPPKPPAPLYADCRAAQIKAQLDAVGAAAGNVSTRIRLTNVSAAPCTFSGYPTALSGIRADGTAQVLHPTHGTMFDEGSAWTANLQPAGAALVSIATSDGCAALNTRHPTKAARRTAFVGEIIGLPGGGKVRARGPFNAGCGVGVSRIGLPQRSAPDPHTYAGLTVSVDQPHTAVAGTTMTFTVTLSDPTRHEIWLTPCPIYQEGLFIGHAIAHTYALNCTSISRIAAGESVTYAMRLAVPNESGQAKFWWSIPAASLVSGGLVTITKP